MLDPLSKCSYATQMTGMMRNMDPAMLKQFGISDPSQLDQARPYPTCSAVELITCFAVDFHGAMPPDRVRAEQEQLKRF